VIGRESTSGGTATVYDASGIGSVLKLPTAIARLTWLVEADEQVSIENYNISLIVADKSDHAIFM
jgi:hypothetical protein